MFKKNKWEVWYDAQPDHIKKWMDEPRPIWYDSDMWRAGLFGVVVGLMIGLII
jgi:hypothetical protein